MNAVFHSEKPLRIAFTGKAGVGKTTAARYLAEHYGYEVVSFAGKLKEIARELFPEAFSGGEKPRMLLQQLGEKMREIDEDVWAKYATRGLKPDARYAIDDLRFRNEERYVRGAGFVVVRIVGPQRVAMPPGTENHVSELEIDMLAPDLVLYNDGTLAQFYREIDKLL